MLTIKSKIENNTFSFLLKNLPKDDFIPFFFCAAADADDGNVW